MKLLVVIPAFNEQETIVRVIKSIPDSIFSITSVDIVVINDGSSDKTLDRAKVAGTKVINYAKNRGLGLVFQRAIQYALENEFDIMVNIDADGQFNGGDIPELVKPILEGSADFVTASRFIDQQLTPSMPVLKKWGNRQVARLISFMSKNKYYDVSCGFRAYSREALLNLNLFGRFTYTHESFLNLIFKDFRIMEVPIKVQGEREFGQSKIAKSLWKYGYNIINTIFRTMLDYKPLKFFGWGGVILIIIGIGFDIFVFIHWLMTSAISPYKTFGFVGLFANLFGFLLVIVGLLADMINRSRLTQERLLYLQKRQIFNKK